MKPKLLNEWEKYLEDRFTEFEKESKREKFPISEGKLLSGLLSLNDTYCITGDQEAIRLYRRYVQKFCDNITKRGRR